jgi:ribonucleotide reductase alpha subunit
LHIGSFSSELSANVWNARYRLRGAGHKSERSVADTWRRIAHALASCEKNPRDWEQAFTDDCAEPGMIFIDRVRRANNLRYCEQIWATNPHCLLTAPLIWARST